MGAVYLGEHSLIGRRAAIKVLHRDRNSQREHIERFFTEARATSAIEDPGIVQIYDFGITPQGVAYLVMEYLDGESLSARMRRLHLLQPYDAVRITRQIAGSLMAVHSIGIVHRDLKPENLFMVRDGEASAGERPKILDFGIAKLGDDRSTSNTRTGAVMGTPASIEQVLERLNNEVAGLRRVATEGGALQVIALLPGGDPDGRLAPILADAGYAPATIPSVPDALLALKSGTLHAVVASRAEADALAAARVTIPVIVRDGDDLLQVVISIVSIS